jgi:hypothetical protein
MILASVQTGKRTRVSGRNGTERTGLASAVSGLYVCYYLLLLLLLQKRKTAGYEVFSGLLALSTIPSMSVIYHSI